MTGKLEIGLETKKTVLVDAKRTIEFMGEALRVYATPELVRDVEYISRDFLVELLDPGCDTVGTRVEIDHMGATLLGMEVEITVRVAAVEGRAVTLEFSAQDPVEKVAGGIHKRFIVEVAKLEERLKAKAAKAKSAKAKSG
jgi:predicted thioesterase